jgi:hypothetical protein
MTTISGTALLYAAGVKMARATHTYAFNPKPLKGNSSCLRHHERIGGITTSQLNTTLLTSGREAAHRRYIEAGDHS